MKEILSDYQKWLNYLNGKPFGIDPKIGVQAAVRQLEGELTKIGVCAEGRLIIDNEIIGSPSDAVAMITAIQRDMENRSGQVRRWKEHLHEGGILKDDGTDQLSNHLINFLCIAEQKLQSVLPHVTGSLLLEDPEDFSKAIGLISRANIAPMDAQSPASEFVNERIVQDVPTAGINHSQISTETQSQGAPVPVTLPKTNKPVDKKEPGSRSLLQALPTDEEAVKAAEQWISLQINKQG